LWGWYEDGGYGHVAAYLATLDLSGFDPKAPPPLTPAFFAIVDAGVAPEVSELADVLDKLKRPPATTLVRLQNEAGEEFAMWLRDRKNRRTIPHRMERCGYTPLRNDDAKDGLWVVNEARQVIYTRAGLSADEKIELDPGFRTIG
jgi:hypothetical protein